MKTRFGLLALAVPALWAVPAKAQFDNYCIMGTLNYCASVRLALSLDGKQLTMQVWNLEGVLGAAHTMTSIGLYNSSGVPFAGTVTLGSVTWVGGAAGGGDSTITSYWSSKKGADIATLAGFRADIVEGTSGNRGINGCTVLPGGAKFTTCSSFPGSPWIEFKFSFDEAYSLEGLELRWHSQQLGANLDGSLKCDTGGAGDYPPCQVIPEPVTVALLGSGLAGLGGFGFIRRRKKNGSDVENG